MTSTRVGATAVRSNDVTLWLRSLIDDCVRIPADAKQGRDAAHRLRMPETNKAAWPQGVVQIFRGDTARSVVEIDQDVAAQHDVETPVLRHGARIDQVYLGELDGIAQAGIDPICARRLAFEVALDQIRRQFHQRTRPI